MARMALLGWTTEPCECIPHWQHAIAGKKLVVAVARKLLPPTLRKRMSDALDVVEMLASNIRDTHAA